VEKRSGDDPATSVDTHSQNQHDLRPLDRGETLPVVVAGRGSARRDLAGGVDELLEREVAVASLAVKVAVLVGAVLDVEGVVLVSAGLEPV
jgi:hypothetical protein